MQLHSRERQTLSANLELLKQNVYPGQIIIAGLVPQNYLALFYATTSWNASTRYCYMAEKDDLISVRPMISRNMEEDRINHTAMTRTVIDGSNLLVVGNGAHTDAVVRRMEDADSFGKVMEDIEFVHPHHERPRIAAMVTHKPGTRMRMQLGITHQKSDMAKKYVRIETHDQLLPYVGFCLPTHTSVKDNPYPKPYEDSPFRILLDGSPNELFNQLCGLLPEIFFVSAVMQVYDMRAQRSMYLLKNRYAPPSLTSPSADA